MAAGADPLAGKLTIDRLAIDGDQPTRHEDAGAPSEMQAGAPAYVLVTFSKCKTFPPMTGP